jgi:hypothetical protein
MRFTTNDDELSISLELDTETADLSTGLGDDILRFAAHQLYLGALTETAPDGRRWASLKPATIAEKGFSTIGQKTGSMVAGLLNGQVTADARSATWTYPAGETFGRAHGFHNGRSAGRRGAADPQPARPLIGWTTDAQEFARQALGA